MVKSNLFSYKTNLLIISLEDSSANHLWSAESKFLKSWIQFTADDPNLPSTSKLQTQSFDSVSATQMQAVDSYFQMYEK